MEEAYPEQNINKSIDRTNAGYNRFYRDKHLVQCPDPDKVVNPFFSAQGELLGTSVSELKRMERSDKSGLNLGPFNSLDEDSLFGSLSDNCSYIPDSNKRSRTKRAPKMSHIYCISRFVDGVIHSSANDLLSNSSSSTENDVYDHIKNCKYCRTQINLKIKNHMVTKTKKKARLYTPTTQPIPQATPQSTLFSKSNSTVLRELLLIIAIGLIIMCVLDAFFIKQPVASQAATKWG